MTQLRSDAHGAESAPSAAPAVTRRRLLQGAAAVAGGVAAGAVLLPTRAHAAPTVYNPFSGFGINDPWDPPRHRGVDFDLDEGTGLPACGAGTIENIYYNGTAGHTVTIYLADGWRSQYMHLSFFLLASGASVAPGTIVGLSGGVYGADGAGNSTGEHVHWHLIDPSGTRVNPLAYVSGGGPVPVPGALSEGVILQEIAQAGGYRGPIDGAPGPNTWYGVQQVVRGYGYTGAVDGVPGRYTYAALQRLAWKGGYGGPDDGVLGPNSWKGVQTILRGFGYAGPIDGVPGTNTYAALQRLAKLGGYKGPIDGALGVNSWRGVQRLLAGYQYYGPIDGVPGVNTYKGLQRLAQLGDYGGPVDGLPGPYTWAALARLI